MEKAARSASQSILEKATQSSSAPQNALADCSTCLSSAFPLILEKDGVELSAKLCFSEAVTAGPKPDKALSISSAF
jgi:hypothetical protein